MLWSSPGGSVTAGMAIYDTMQYIKCDVSTICIGMAASMGAFLLSSGAQGKRIALPNAEIMIHQPSAGTQGKVTDMEIDVEHFLKLKKRLNQILADNTGKDPEQVKQDSERDHWMLAEEARNTAWWTRSFTRGKQWQTIRKIPAVLLLRQGGEPGAPHDPGPGGVRICDECVQLCMSILDDGTSPAMRPGTRPPISCPPPREIKGGAGSVRHRAGRRQGGPVRGGLQPL